MAQQEDKTPAQGGASQNTADQAQETQGGAAGTAATSRDGVIESGKPEPMPEQPTPEQPKPEPSTGS